MGSVSKKNPKFTEIIFPFSGARSEGFSGHPITHPVWRRHRKASVRLFFSTGSAENQWVEILTPYKDR